MPWRRGAGRLTQRWAYAILNTKYQTNRRPCCCREYDERRITHGHRGPVRTRAAEGRVGATQAGRRGFAMESVHGVRGDKVDPASPLGLMPCRRRRSGGIHHTDAPPSRSRRRKRPRHTRPCVFVEIDALSLCHLVTWCGCCAEWWTHPRSLSRAAIRSLEAGLFRSMNPTWYQIALAEHEIGESEPPTATACGSIRSRPIRGCSGLLARASRANKKGPRQSWQEPTTSS